MTRVQGSINHAHGDDFSRARNNVHVNHSKKRLSNTLMSFKVVRNFLCLQANNIQHNKI